MGKILYAIKPIGVSKSYNRVYNKQEHIAKYNVDEINGLTNIHLIETLDFNRNNIKKSTFKITRAYPKHDAIDRYIKTELDKSPIYTGAPRSDYIILFETFEEAQAQKLLDLMQIKDYFKKALEGILLQMEKNLPKDLDETYDKFFTKYPEYLI